jgi:L-threonylcarbamoyladenylate synthase
VSREQLQAVLDVEMGIEPRPAASEGGSGLQSPGLLEKHYAPLAEVILLDGTDDAVRRELIRRAKALQARGIRAGALLTEEDADALAAALPVGPIVARLGPAGDTEAIARCLFAALRELERQGAAVILARLVDAGGLGDAVRDRLRRAAGGRVISV